MGDLGLIPVLGRFPGEGNSYPLQYSDLGCKESDTTEQLSVSLINATTWMNLKDMVTERSHT